MQTTSGREDSVITEDHRPWEDEANDHLVPKGKSISNEEIKGNGPNSFYDEHNSEAIKINMVFQTKTTQACELLRDISLCLLCLLAAVFSFGAF